MNRIKYLSSVRSWNKNFLKCLEVTKNQRIFAEDWRHSAICKQAFIALAGTNFAFYLLIMEEEYGKLYQI